MSERDDRIYFERKGDSIRVMNADEKGESDINKFAGMVMLIGIAVILFNMGFSPLSFFAIIVWSVACFLLRYVIAMLAGLAILGLIGYWVIRLFFF